MKKIEIDGITVSYDINKLIETINRISYHIENYINYREGIDELHEGAPTEEEFISLRNEFATNVLNIENQLPNLIRENLFLTQKGVLAKNRRRPILMGGSGFYVNIIDEYDHDHQFERPYLKLERTGNKTGELIIHIMQTNY